MKIKLLKSKYQKILYLIHPKFKWDIIFLCLFLFIGMLLEMLSLGILFPFLKILIDKNIINEFPIIKPFFNFLGNPNQAKLIYFGIIFIFILYSFKAIFLTFMTWKQHKFTSNLALDLSEELFLGYLNQSYSFHLKNNSSLLLRNIQNEVTQFTSAVQSFINLILEITIIISATALLIFVQPIATAWVIIFLSISAYIFNAFTKKKMLIWGKERQFTIGKSNKVLIEGFGSIKDIIMFNSKSYFNKRFSKYFQKHVIINAKVAVLGTSPRFYLEYLSVLGLILLIINTIFQNQNPEKLVPVLGIFLIAAFKLMPSFNRIMSASQIIKFSEPVVSLLFNEIKLNNERIINNKIENKIIDFKYLEVIDLSFTHLGTTNLILKNIKLKIIKGETVGFIGPSGSGKSTLIDLLLGLFIPTNGSLILNDLNLNYIGSDWRKIIGYVPQSIYLLDDSIKKNIAFGIPYNEIDQNLLDKSIEDAHLTEFICSLEKGIDTIVGERGVRLSGGQRQRIGIARALYNNPQVLFFDEATSSLDSDTEKSIMNSIFNLKKKKTILIIAHRISTLEFCDIIYELENGVIINNYAPSQILKN